MIKRLVPNSIVEFNLNQSFDEPQSIITYDESGRRQIAHLGSGRMHAHVEMEIIIPADVMLEKDRHLAVVAFIRGQLQEWERALRNPEITGNEPQLGTKR